MHSLTRNHFFDKPIKNKQEAYEKPIEISRKRMVTQQETYFVFMHTVEN